MVLNTLIIVLLLIAGVLDPALKPLIEQEVTLN